MSTFKADYIIARQEEIAGNTSSIPVKTVVNGTPKAWVNFNGTGTIAARASFNFASLTDNGVGDYTVNFASSLADANYGLTISGYQTTGGAIFLGMAHGGTYTSSSVRVVTYNSAFTITDMVSISVATVR